MLPGNQPSLIVEAGGESVKPIWTVHVVLYIFFARPHDFHRPGNFLRDLDRTCHAVALETTAEATADQMVMNHDLV